MDSRTIVEAGKSSQPYNCILHLDTDDERLKEGIILPFKPSNWASVKEAATRRKNKIKFQSSKYRSIIEALPEEIDICKHGYHTQCYKNFTAVPMSNSAENQDSTSDKKHLRSDTPQSWSLMHSQSTTGIFPKSCIFCKKVRLRKGSTEETLGCCQTKQAECAIKDAAIARKDNVLLTLIADVDFVAKEVMYHHSCKRSYVGVSGKATSVKISNCDNDSPQCEEIAIYSIYSYVEKSIIINKRPELLPSIYKRYIEMCDDAEEEPLTSARNLLSKLENRFGCRLKTSTLSKNKGTVVYTEGLAEVAMRMAFDYTCSEEAIIIKAALHLRKALKAVPKIPLKDPLTVGEIKAGEGSPPDSVNMFFRTLYGGPNIATHNSNVERRALSSSQDALFVVRNGRVKPAKQIILGMAIKSMTGNKKLVRIMNRFGHIINYHAIEQIETSLGQSIIDRNEACPTGTASNLVMGLAFDNFDELSETLSGANTLHDTMGILYQNKSPHNEIADLPTNALPQQIQKGKRRMLQIPPISLEPYRKKPRMGSFAYEIHDMCHRPDGRMEGETMDLTWMMCHAMLLKNVPMWVGFNSLIHTDNLPEQVVLYMKNLNLPITRLDVIQETLVTTQRCAQEVGQQYGVVSYDLNAAKPAMQIKATDAPRYDDIFIMPGSFHIEMAFFKAIGKIIEESGGPKMLTDSLVLAPGSLNGFLSGKHFNRCKRLHPLLALAFEILHFQSFIEASQQNVDCECPTHELTPLLNKLWEKTDENTWNVVKSSDEFNSVIHRYRAFTDETRKGAHGATAQFWMMYVDYIHDYHNLERAIRTNDVDLFMHALTPIINLFFATNHINYSRWLSKFQLDLLNIDNTHPGLRAILRDGVFTVRRTNKPFSRTPVDLTLEQTVNADAASRRTGISAATNNYSSRLRWMVTKSTRAAVVSMAQEMAGISGGDDSIAELRSSRIRRDTNDAEKLLIQIKDSCDPFSSTSSEKLFNISSGKAVSPSVQICLLGTRDRGNTRHDSFVQSCFDDPANFEKPLKKERLETFKQECKSNKCTADKKVASLVATRDLMGRLVILATKQNLDLKYVFTYPLTPLPLSMCSPDGMMAKTEKSSLLKILEQKSPESTPPKTVDACIIDGQFLLHSLPPHMPGNYGGLAASILRQATYLSRNRIDIVFDAYPCPSIKDSERARRGIEENECIITGPEQHRPKKMADSLKSRSFKEQLPPFLAREWGSQEYVHIIGDRCVYISFIGACFRFYVINGAIVKESVLELAGNHEEADTRICAHVKAMNSLNVKDIVIRASDTDIAVIMLYHSKNFTANIWMDVGTASKNDRRYINLSGISAALGQSLCDSLLGFHSFTGCDYTSAFVRKGKVRPFALLEKDTSAQTVFAKMSIEKLDRSSVEILKCFTSKVYAAKVPSTPLNQHRYNVFAKGYGPKATAKNPLEKLKGIAASAIPPCESELVKHINRASFVARMWANADQKDIEQHPSVSDGWRLDDSGLYQIIWFEGPQLPSTLIPHGECVEDDGDGETDIELSSSDEDDILSEKESESDTDN